MSPEERSVYSVTELVQAARALIEGNFPRVLVQGEISGLRSYPSGHLYFDLKDGRSLLKCVLFRGFGEGLPFRPEDGMSVVAGGTLTLYEARGQFQLLVRSLEPRGAGALQAAFERLKRRLAEEGLFDESRKKPWPAFPRRVALVTSPVAAALQDFLKTLGDHPVVELEALDLHPVRVQGDGAAEEIAAALARIGRERRHDAVVLLRGGGSLEDLWAFNEEVAVRAVADCPVPVMCGVGHEVDFTLCDFAADRRAPTPTAAARMLGPAVEEVRGRVEALQGSLEGGLREAVRGAKRAFGELKAALERHRPEALVREARQRLDEQAARMERELRRAAGEAREEWESLRRRLGRWDWASRRREFEGRVVRWESALRRWGETGLERARARLRTFEQLLAARHPEEPLRRGFAMVTRRTTGEVLRDSRTMTVGEAIDVRLHRGSFEAEVRGIHPALPEEEMIPRAGTEGGLGKG